MDERAFLERLRARAPLSAAREIAPLPAAPLPGREALVESMRANGMTVHEVRADGIAEAVASASAGARVFSCWRTALLEAVPARVRALGLEEVALPDPPADVRPALDRAIAGIVEADAVIAETGTLGLLGGPGRPLLAALFSRTLIAVVPADRIVPRLDDIAGWIDAHGCPNLSLISGPSRTGDVAQRHILGAHGPAAIHVVLAG